MDAAAPYAGGAIYAAPALATAYDDATAEAMSVGEADEAANAAFAYAPADAAGNVVADAYAAVASRVAGAVAAAGSLTVRHHILLSLLVWDRRRCWHRLRTANYSREVARQTVLPIVWRLEARLHVSSDQDVHP